MAELRRFKISGWLLGLRRMLRNDQLILAVLATLVGGLAGGGIVLLRYAIDLVQIVALGSISDALARHAASLPWWRILLSTTAGGLFVGLFVHYALPGGRPQGIAKVIESGLLADGRMSLRAGLVAAIASAASMGFGASVGREGPAVHLGATLGAWIAEKLRLTRPLMRTLLGCGAAAAVSASFNAPIAGALFAHEVVVGHFALSAFAPIVIASVVGTMIARSVFGDFPAFDIEDQVLSSLFEFPAIAGLGVLAGGMAVVFMRGTFWIEDASSRLLQAPGFRTATGGFAVGLIAIFFPQILGVGYDATDMALRQEFSLALLLALVIAKTLASAISLGTGFSGGVFSPTLMIGTVLGSAYGIIVTSILPEYSSGPSAYAVIGMGAVAAAVLGAPISTVLMVFELTDNYALTVGVMVAVVISCTVAQRFAGKSFFDLQLGRAGHARNEVSSRTSIDR